MSNKKAKQEEPADSILVTAAKTIGRAAGKIASVVSGGKSSHDDPGTKTRKTPTNKGRKTAVKKTGLPRKAKKAAKIAARKTKT